MLRPALIMILIAIAPPLRAQPTLSIQDLGGGTFDIEVDLRDGVSWTSGGLFGETFGGATFSYQAAPTGEPLLTAPGVPAQVTFVSLPTPPNAPQRFDERRAPILAGAYRGEPAGGATTTPRLVDVGFFKPVAAEATTGAFARVVLDLSGIGFGSEDVFATSSDLPDGGVLLASGWAASTSDDFDDTLVELEWQVYAIPEPGSLALLLLVGTAGYHLRRTAT